MSEDTDALRAALAPVAGAVVGEAHAAAAETLGAADASARSELDRARGEVRRVLEQARHEGEAAAQRVSAARLSAARREARLVVLRARDRVLADLRAAVLQELARRGEDPSARRLAARLGELSAAAAGPGALVHHEGPGGLDVVAEADGRRVELRVVALVDRVLSLRGAEVEELWAP